MTRDRLLTITLLIVTGIIACACLLLLAPFVSGLTLAAALAIVAYPVYSRIQRTIHKPSLSAGLAVAVITIALVAPVVLLGIQIAGEIAENVAKLRQVIESGGWRSAIESKPWLAAGAAWLERNYDLKDAAAKLADTARSQAGRLLKAGFGAMVQLGVALFSLFFFFRDRGQVLRGIRGMIPLSQAESDEVFERVRSMVRATLYGNVMTSLIQGALGGLMFWFLGLPAPLLWGAAMFFFSLVPGLGSFLVWAPTAVVLAATGHWGKAGILTGWGVVVVGSIDNLLYPLLVGRDIRMHTLAVFLALLGGLFIFGPAGLVIGPVLASVAFALVDILRRRTARAA